MDTRDVARDAIGMMLAAVDDPDGHDITRKERISRRVEDVRAAIAEAKADPGGIEAVFEAEHAMLQEGWDFFGFTCLMLAEVMTLQDEGAPTLPLRQYLYMARNVPPRPPENL